MKEQIDEFIEDWNDYVDACDLLTDTKGKAIGLKKVNFGTYCCMIMEEYCAANNLDPVEFSQWIADNVKIMAEKNGR